VRFGRKPFFYSKSSQEGYGKQHEIFPVKTRP
jgi:hypothetical protein